MRYEILKILFFFLLLKYTLYVYLYRYLYIHTHIHAYICIYKYDKLLYLYIIYILIIYDDNDDDCRNFGIIIFSRSITIELIFILYFNLFFFLVGKFCYLAGTVFPCAPFSKNVVVYLIHSTHQRNEFSIQFADFCFHSLCFFYIFLVFYNSFKFTGISSLFVVCRFSVHIANEIKKI